MKSIFLRILYSIIITHIIATNGFLTAQSLLNIPVYERQALYDLYNSTNGNDWVYQKGDKGHWDFTDPNVNPCLYSNIWQGLNCTILTTSFNYYYISDIILPDYNLIGFLPDSIGNLSHLQYLDLSYNKIYGEIPSTICNLSELIVLALSYNKIKGTIPYTIGNLSKLKFLNLTDNEITETIPNSIQNLSNLTVLDLTYNHLTGIIPDWIGELSSLRYLGLGTNYFTDTIPNSLYSLKRLTGLDLSYNELSGSISNHVGDLSFLTGLGLSKNYFNNTIPQSLSKLQNLRSLYLSFNQLSGPLPSELVESSLLSILYIDSNFLSSIIPIELSKLFALERLYLDHNLFTGSIPNIFNNMKHLTIMEFQNNYFTGSLPTSIGQLSLLTRCFLQNNHLSGDLDEVFDGNYQKQLLFIQLSSNQFTGKLSEQMFLSNTLKGVSAGNNCFHGSIPSIICENTNLVALNLDGLVCATSCQNKIIPSMSTAYISDNKIKGGIPQCLWSMSKLQVLHLSGNSLTGSLPDNIEISDSLIDLSLSYNLLTGSIPSLIQKREWYNLDLSNNRISGTLQSDYVSQSINSSLSLKNNRLSGTIPNHIQNMKNISILEGNFYNCKVDRSDLPTHDENKDKYACGSNTFNIYYYIWLGLLVIFMIIIVLVRYYRELIDKYVQLSSTAQLIVKYIHIIDYITVQNVSINSNDIANLKQYYIFLQLFLRFSFYSAIYIIFILLPVYLVISIYYSTHTYEYAWTVSILYFSGKEAFGVIMVMLLLFTCIQVLVYKYILSNSTYNHTLNDKEQEQKDLVDKLSYAKSSKWKIYGLYVIYILINFIAVGGANVAYIIVALYQSNNLIILTQILLSIFKMVWNNIISPRMVRLIIDYLSMLNINNKQVIQRRLFVLQLIVSLINNIVIPCVVVAIISPNCLYNVFHPESHISSSISYRGCFLYNESNDCIKSKIYKSTTKYSPPFVYSYQCSSDFVTYYASVFAFMCIISTFIVPFIDRIAMYLSQRYSKSLSALHELQKLLYLDVSAIVPPLIYIDDMYEILVSLLTSIGLLLTFGTVFPPLTVLFLIAMLRRIYFHKAIIGRYISYAIDQKAYLCIYIINQDCKVIPLLSTLHLCGWILCYVSYSFYTMFLFDILGDDVGVNKAYWVLIVIPCIPLYMHIIYKLYKYLMILKSMNNISTKANNNNNNNNNNNTNENQEVELSTTQSIGSPCIHLSMISNPFFIKSNIDLDVDHPSIIEDVVLDDIYVEDREGNSIISPLDNSINV